MPLFSRNQPIVTDTPTIVVENKLTPGPHRFSLLVIDDKGLKSDVAVQTVTVRQIVSPTGGGGVIHL